MAGIYFLLSSGDENETRPGHEEPLPWKMHRPTSYILSDRMRVLVFYSGAAVLGLLVHLILFGPYLQSTNAVDVAVSEPCTITPAHTLVEVPYTRPGLGQRVPADEEWSLERKIAQIKTTKGYYVRDYSVWLGWNNMRYIIEAAALHAHLLGRTLVVPTYVYARACEWDIHVCASYAEMVNRNDAMDLTEWRLLPLPQQMGWRVPIEVMLDLNSIRKQLPVITIADFLSIHGLNPSLEVGNGNFKPDIYLNTTTMPRPSLYIIPNTEFDPKNISRVDRLFPRSSLPKNLEPTNGTVQRTIYDYLVSKLSWEGTIDLEDVPRLIRDVGERLEGFEDEASLLEYLKDHGFGMLYTYYSRPGAFQKNVAQHLKVIAPFFQMRGLVDDYGSRREDVLFAQGELHDLRKPGSLRFTSLPPLNDFTNLVLRSIVHPAPIDMLADLAAKEMLERTGGRMWMAAHMRRGDFDRYHLVIDPSPEEEIDRIVLRLQTGGQSILKAIAAENWTRPHLADVPGVIADRSFVGMELPQPGSKWYLATDERAPEVLAYARSKGAILVSDLLPPRRLIFGIDGHPLSESALERLVGWPLLLTDVLGVVEQTIMARASVFYGQYRSSVAGGVVNLRAVRGMDTRTILLDGP